MRLFFAWTMTYRLLYNCDLIFTPFSDTLVTPTDVKLLQAIEEMIGTSLTEMEVDEKAVGEIILQVGVTKREEVICLI